MLLTKPLFFDTDCLCAFLWVGNESLLPRLYPGRIVIPRPVYTELCNPRTPHLKRRIDGLVSQGLVSMMGIAIDSEEYQTYYRLTEAPGEGHALIGKGEAAAISLAKRYGGVVASNNLRDINPYIEEFSLEYATTGDILVDAYHRGLFSEGEGNAVWRQMLEKRRRLGTGSFTEYLESGQHKSEYHESEYHKSEYHKSEHLKSKYQL